MTTLILGATGGIGSTLTRLWTQDELWLSGRDGDKLQVLADGRQANILKADVGFESQVSRLFEQLPGTLDTIVYAAGSAHPEALAQAKAENVRQVWNANYFGLLWTLKYGLPKLAAGGRLYVVGAREDLTTARGFSQYAASKAAVARLLSIARLEARGKMLTLVLPPAVDTGLWAQVGKVPKGAVSPDVVAQAIMDDRGGAGQEELRI
ncbi:SDR family NAD(P)-dependent oxidoreductase [Deinococcus rubellus]|uniref:SDR family NAD(P)-dependent oxidoreductase n=1 Tax=Deinococcus rubellus TaxID=1889240 RepID=A0ABY5YLM1_9DEIO|nr:SDR family NAD(P)-dependent oxidoreductase [Deinococcus rubellus]UWX65031.1 SDR family NAD(P)-dependent oxidoreductase [Deinococcus rubellus]